MLVASTAIIFDLKERSSLYIVTRLIILANVIDIVPTLAGTSSIFIDAVAVNHDAVIIKPCAPMLYATGSILTVDGDP